MTRRRTFSILELAAVRELLYRLATADYSDPEMVAIVRRVQRDVDALVHRKRQGGKSPSQR
jgi:hypothetical protein